MNGSFLLYKPTIASWWNTFYLILESSTKFRAVLKGVNQVQFYLYEILMEIQMKEKRVNFLKTWKTRFWENINFKRFTVTLSFCLINYFFPLFSKESLFVYTFLLSDLFSPFLLILSKNGKSMTNLNIRLLFSQPFLYYREGSKQF